MNAITTIRKAIEESRGREKNVTEGPWTSNKDGDVWSRNGSVREVMMARPAIAAYVASSRTDLPHFREALLIAVEALGQIRGMSNEGSVQNDLADEILKKISNQLNQ